MVLMSRRYSKNNCFVLPPVSEYKEKEHMKSLDQTAQFHQMYENEICTQFWSSGQLSQVANSKKGHQIWLSQKAQHMPYSSKMVVKSRSYSKNNRFVLSPVDEYKEKEHMKSLDQTAPLRQMYDDESDTPLRRSGQLSQVANSKKHDTLPAWGNPPDEYYVGASAQPKSQIEFRTRRTKADLWCFFTFCLVVIGGMTYWHLKTSLLRSLEETETALAARNLGNVKLRSAKERHLRMLSREVAAANTIMLEKQRERLGKMNVREHVDSAKYLSDVQSALDDIRGQVEYYQEQKTVLKDAVQHQSRKSVEVKYGKQKTIQVEFTLDFPDGREGPSSFKVEIASLDLMPNTVYTFLEMVDQGLWDGCSFVMKAIHVLKAVPLPYEDQTQDPVRTAKIFAAKNLNGPIFKEYNYALPHTPYTLGFAGGDIPSFYISTKENTDLHAGDSSGTFGRVVDGFDTLERVDAVPAENGIWLRGRIGIKSTKIIVL